MLSIFHGKVSWPKKVEKLSKLSSICRVPAHVEVIQPFLLYDSRKNYSITMAIFEFIGLVVIQRHFRFAGENVMHSM